MTESELDYCGHKYMTTCKCSMMQTLCTFGPDEKGNLRYDIEMDEEDADDCPKDNCICTSDDNYHEILASRVAIAEETKRNDKTLHI